MLIQDIIYKRASQDFYRLGLTPNIVRPNILFDGSISSGGSPLPESQSVSQINSQLGAPPVTASKYVNIGLAEVGVHDFKKNSGPRVNEYQKSSGSGSGAPWCASFVTWCLTQAGVDMSQFNFGKAAVRNWVDWAQRNGRLKDSNPEVGDLFYWLNSDRTGHIGMVVSVNPDGSFKTVEGNTSGGDRVREGDVVASKTRSTFEKRRPPVKLISMRGIK